MRLPPEHSGSPAGVAGTTIGVAVVHLFVVCFPPQVEQAIVSEGADYLIHDRLIPPLLPFGLSRVDPATARISCTRYCVVL
jgi:hypothetical protein